MFTSNSAFRFIILLGIVSLFADITYEGARSITGPFLAILGANAAVMGFVAGFGELVGYALRMVSGYFADRTQKYWTITLWGYACNLIAVPLLALANHWWVASILIVIERMGKAIRSPARDAMLSFAAKKVGTGIGFGLNEALDQIGAMLGPIVVSGILFFRHDYHESFLFLAIPALLAMLSLWVAKHYYPNPRELEARYPALKKEGIPKTFWFYLIGAGFVAAGFTDFPLIAYHFEKKHVLDPVWIPLVYALSMGVTGITAPLLGRFYDHKGFIILTITTFVTCWFSLFIYLGNVPLILVGVVLWGIGMGAHESLMRAIIANMVSANKRASAYGIFNLCYGVSWFLGSVTMGILYDISISWLIWFSIIAQLLAMPFLLRVAKG